VEPQTEGRLSMSVTIIRLGTKKFFNIFPGLLLAKNLFFEVQFDAPEINGRLEGRFYRYMLHCGHGSFTLAKIVCKTAHDNDSGCAFLYLP